MSDLVGTQIVGFLMHRIICNLLPHHCFDTYTQVAFPRRTGSNLISTLMFFYDLLCECNRSIVWLGSSVVECSVRTLGSSPDRATFFFSLFLSPPPLTGHQKKKWEIKCQEEKQRKLEEEARDPGFESQSGHVLFLPCDIRPNCIKQ